MTYLQIFPTAAQEEQRLWASDRVQSFTRTTNIAGQSWDNRSSNQMNTAVQLWEGQLSVITTPIPHVSSSNEVLVKVAFSGVCGTDIHIIAGEFPSSKCVILGHEFAGVVSEVGASVKGISLGDR